MIAHTHNSHHHLTTLRNPLNLILMATNWLKSLQCNSKSTTTIDDVITPSSSCRYSYHSLKHLVHTHHPSPIPNPKPKSKPQPKPKPKPETKPEPKHKPKPAHVMIKPMPLTHPFFPSMTELQVGHPSRNVVEMIFISRWGPKGFPGRVEMVFKVQNKTRVLSRFEEYREVVKSKSKSGSGSGSGRDARCSADGNEMMRFRCVGPTFEKKKGVVICTYGSSGVAHESGGGEGGRRGMLVCRVIAGRVLKRVGFEENGNNAVESEFDSVSREDGELVVFDHRAVLNCFLLIYKL